MSKRKADSSDAPPSKRAKGEAAKFNIMMCGTGEYTTGYVHSGGSKSDKKMGVIALVGIDLRRRGKVDKLGLCGTTGKKFPGIREHMKKGIGSYANMDVSCDTFPADDVARNVEAYKDAIDACQPGDGVTIFTPDDTHFEIALYAINKGLHVLVTKPAVKTVSEHKRLVEAARKNGVLVQVEFHKRWDPLYADARERIRAMGDCAYFVSHMSQPKYQLDTFKSWAGKSSDISYYLNTHHMDFHAWALEDVAKPVRVTAMGSTGIAESDAYGCPPGTEDTITVMAQWKSKTGALGTGVYTASWAASSKSEVHSQQRFCYMGHGGEVRVDQAHRGYDVSTDAEGYSTPNPLFMKYTPDGRGCFAGQRGYGYLSIESWVDACREINAGRATAEEFDALLPTLATTLTTTALAEAGRRSLDQQGASIDIEELIASS